MIKIRLLGNTVHLWPIKGRLITALGIHLPEQYQDDRSQYKILGVGPGKRLKDGTVRPVEASPGQFCLVPHLQDSRTLDDGSIIANADQIAAVWDPDDEPKACEAEPHPSSGGAAE